MNENAEVPKPASSVAGEGKEEPEKKENASPAPPPPEQPQPPQQRNWTVPPDVMGQEAIIRALGELLDMAETDADQDEFERQNAERIAKITGEKGRQLRARFADKRRARQGDTRA